MYINIINGISKLWLTILRNSITAEYLRHFLFVFLISHITLISVSLFSILIRYEPIKCLK